MKILVACEESGTVREAFRANGHNAWSCDILPTRIPNNHFQNDISVVIDWGWDMMIAFPPCTHLCVSGARWFKEKRQEKGEATGARRSDRSKEKRSNSSSSSLIATSPKLQSKIPLES